MSIQRVQSGVPTGGQFSGTAHEESSVALDEDDRGDLDGVEGRCEQCGQWTSPNNAHICGAHTALAARMDEVHHKVEVANRRLARLGLEDRFEVEILGERTESRTTEGGQTETRDMVDYRLNRPSIKLGDWTFAGRLDVLSDGTPVAMTAPGVELNGFRPDTQMCDHCGTNRNRTSTYLLQDRQGEVKQVGSNCLEAFTGIAPKGLWSMEWEAEDQEESEGFGSGGWESATAPADIVCMSLAVTGNGRAYLSNQRAEYQGGIPSGSQVREYLFPTPRVRETEEYQAAEALATGPETVELAQRVLEFARNMEGDGDYPSNLRAMAQQEHLTYKHIGLMASAVSGWHREQEKLAEQAAERAAPSRNEWIGSPKDKLAGIPVTVVGLTYIPGEYGTTTLITMRDDQGRALKWFASNPPKLMRAARL